MEKMAGNSFLSQVPILAPWQLPTQRVCAEGLGVQSVVCRPKHPLETCSKHGLLGPFHGILRTCNCQDAQDMSRSLTV